MLQWCGGGGGRKKKVRLPVVFGGEEVSSLTGSQSSSRSEPLNCDSHINAIKLVGGIPTFCLNSQC